MADRVVTVAVPVLDGGPLLEETLAAVAGQKLDSEIELLVADSGSRDGSVELARAFGATVARVERYSHGGTRNELMERARGSHVAFLTQDAVPADDRWLARLLGGFAYGDRVALVYGPYRARPGAPVSVSRELDVWFASLSRDGRPRIDRDGDGLGPATFFTDANGCVARSAWQRVPFREVPYAEDHVLALDMLRAGYAKVFEPDAVVIHSHDYGVTDQFKRSFDEWRALREVHGWVEPAGTRRLAAAIARGVRDDWRAARSQHVAPTRLAVEMRRSVRHWTVRSAGAVAGSRADRLAPAVRRACSLERRGSFEPLAPRST